MLAWAQVERVWDAAVGSAMDRRTTFVALGGGVIGDMTGFAAAAYQRGVHFLQARHFAHASGLAGAMMKPTLPTARKCACSSKS